MLAPWCEVRDFVDLLGNSSKTINFRIGKYGRNRRAPGYYPVAPRGTFAFRYAFWSPATNKWISGAWSEPVFARPKAWVIGIPDPGSPLPAGAYPSFRQIGKEMAGMIRLACTVGGKVR
jgi:hypothetical protein